MNLENLPALQSTQADPSGSVRVPAAQLAQTEAPADEYVPPGQAAQKSPVCASSGK